MNAAPLLTTERLGLWQPQASDLAGLDAINSDPRTLAFLGNWTPSEADSFARLMRNAGSWALYGYGLFMLRRHDDERIAGICGVFHSFRGFGEGLDDTPEAGWIIHPDDWGQGLASEAMRAILSWFDKAHGPRRIACMIEEGHAVSERLAGQLGFVPYGRHEKPADGETPLVLLSGSGPPKRPTARLAPGSAISLL